MTEAQPPSPQVREPLLRSPAIVLMSIVVFAAIHVATLFLAPNAYERMIEQYGLVPSHVQAALGTGSYGLTTLKGLLPLVTYTFLHGGWMHLAVNSLAFLIFGTVVARRVGGLRFVGLGLVAGVGAALAHLAVHWGDNTPVIGASGAIAGYMGAASRFVFYDPRNPPSGPGHRLPLTARPVINFALVWTVLNVAIGITGFSPDGGQDLTAWEAHLGGFYAGLLLFPLFDRRQYWLG